VFSSYLMVPEEESRLGDPFIHLDRWLLDGIAVLMRVRSFRIPPAEASRDGRSERTHAHLPADIFSSTVQMGALPDYASARIRPIELPVLREGPAPRGSFRTGRNHEATDRPLVALAIAVRTVRSSTAGVPRSLRGKA
jgi:hypothetical protein